MEVEHAVRVGKRKRKVDEAEEARQAEKDREELVTGEATRQNELNSRSEYSDNASSKRKK